MAMGLKFTTYRNPARMGRPRGICCGKLTHSRILDLDAMAEEIAASHCIKVEDARYYCNLIGNYATKALCEGKKLDFGDFSLSLTLRGSFPAANSAYDPERNSLALVATSSANMKRRLAKLRPQNEGSAEKPAIKSVICNDVAPIKDKVIKLGCKVFLTGDNFIVDASRDDEGIWLADATAGTLLAKGEVLQSTRTTLDASFDANAGLAPGKYSLVLYTRTGDASAPSPSRTSLRIELIQ